MVTFNYPIYLVLALFLVPGFLLVSALVSRLQKAAIDEFGRRQILGRFSRFSSKGTTALIVSSCLALLAIAAAQPMLKSGQDAFFQTLNAIIVMDVSRSMLAEDGIEGKSRLESGIAAVERLLDAYPDGRFGLIIYTSKVVTYSPTADHAALRIILRDILGNYSIRGVGSEPVAALQDAGKLIEELPYRVDTIFLISDGGVSLAAKMNRPPLAPVTSKLQNLGLRVVVVGVGRLLPTAIPVYADDGQLVGYHRYEGAIVYTSLDENSLKGYAVETAGWYYRLAAADDLVQIARSRNLDKQPVAQETAANLVWLPVAICLLLVALWLHPRIS